MMIMIMMIVVIMIMMISGDGSSSDWRPTWAEFPAQSALAAVFPPAASASSHVLVSLASLQQLPGLQQEDTQM